MVIKLLYPFVARVLCNPLRTLCAPSNASVDTNCDYVSSDHPIEMSDPYRRQKRLCFICQRNVPLDYKFVSPYTGRIYGRHITGLCIPMQKRVAQLITRSRQCGMLFLIVLTICAGFMAFEHKESVFITDPRIVAKS